METEFVLKQNIEKLFYIYTKSYVGDVYLGYHKCKGIPYLIESECVVSGHAITDRSYGNPISWEDVGYLAKKFDAEGKYVNINNKNWRNFVKLRQDEVKVDDVKIDARFYDYYGVWIANPLADLNARMEGLRNIYGPSA